MVHVGAAPAVLYCSEEKEENYPFQVADCSLEFFPALTSNVE